MWVTYQSKKKTVASFDNAFWEAFCFFSKKAKALTNKSKHKTLKTTFTYMSHQTTFSTQKAHSKNFYQTNP
jgi:hypothetical protein